MNVLGSIIRPMGECFVDGNGECATKSVFLPESAEYIWGGLASLIIFFMLYKFAWPQIKKSMEARTARIQKELDDAAADKASADAEAAQIRTALGDIAALAALTNGQLADVVVDATGSHKSMVRAMELAAFAGRVVFVGITQHNLEFPHAPFLHRRELTLMASRNALPGDFTRIIKLIGEGKIDTAPWITHHATFDEVPAIFPSWVKPETGVIKAVVTLE
jgi:threonine dehydrogenase-like Zn-dependent dehydrogenase